MTMKKLFLVLMVAMMLGACGESSTDGIMRSTGDGNGALVPPDLVIATDEVTLDGFAPGNPVAIAASEALVSHASVAEAIATARSFGYGFDPAQVALATGRLEDGREVVVALGVLTGGHGSDGHMVHIRVGDREVTRALRLRGDGDGGFDPLELAVKGELGPQGAGRDATFADCLIRIMSDLASCRRQCEACALACVMEALTRLAACVAMTMF
jgi:hypothetical protein